MECLAFFFSFSFYISALSSLHWPIFSELFFFTFSLKVSPLIFWPLQHYSGIYQLLKSPGSFMEADSSAHLRFAPQALTLQLPLPPHASQHCRNSFCSLTSGETPQFLESPYNVCSSTGISEEANKTQ